MILRCTAPRKNDKLRACGQWLGAVPDGAIVLRDSASDRTFWDPKDAHQDHWVLVCDRCNTLYEVAGPLRQSA